MSINVVTISGNLTRDPEFRMAKSGDGGVLTFSIAVNERRQNPQTNQWEDVPNFVDCVVFGKRATALGNILHKGLKVSISGKLRMSQWQDKSTGKNRTKLDVVVSECEFMTARDAQQPMPQQQAAPQQPMPQQQAMPQQGYYM